MINVNPIKILIIFSLILCSCTSEPIKCDLVIYNGTIYDGSGENPFIGSVGLIDDKIVYLVEINQAGIFLIKNIPEDVLGRMLATSCANILFPFALKQMALIRMHPLLHQ